MSWSELDSSITVVGVQNIMRGSVSIISEPQSVDLDASIDPRYAEDLDGSINVGLGRFEFILGSIIVTHSDTVDLNASINPKIHNDLDASILVRYHNFMRGTVYIISEPQIADLNASITVQIAETKELDASLTVRLTNEDYIIGSIYTVYATESDLDASIAVYTYVDLDATLIVSYYNIMTVLSSVVEPPYEELVAYPVQDAFIRDSQPLQNYGIEEDMLVGVSNSSGEVFRSLVQFDISSIRPDMVIDSASLKIFNANFQVVEIPIEFYLIDEVWQESGVNWLNQPNYTDLVSLQFSESGLTYVQVDILTVVYDWYQGNTTNNGFLIKATNEVDAELLRYYTREGTTPPILYVKYHDPILYMSLGRSDLQCSIYVIARGYSDLECSITPTTYDEVSDITATIEVKEPTKLDCSITVNKPYLEGVIYVVQTTTDDLNASIQPVYKSDLLASITPIPMFYYVNDAGVVTDKATIEQYLYETPILEEIRSIDKEVIVSEALTFSEFQYFGRNSTDSAVGIDSFKDLEVKVFEDVTWVTLLWSTTVYFVNDSGTFGEYQYFAKDDIDSITSEEIIELRLLSYDIIDSTEVFNKDFNAFDSVVYDYTDIHLDLFYTDSIGIDDLLELSVNVWDSLANTGELFNKDFNVFEQPVYEYTRWIDLNLNDSTVSEDIWYWDTPQTDEGTFTEYEYESYKEVMEVDPVIATEYQEILKWFWNDLDVSMGVRVKAINDLLSSIFVDDGIYWVELELDTTAPEGIVMILNNGNGATQEDIVPLEVLTTDQDTTNYEMLVWGDVNPLYNLNIQLTEGASSWFAYDPAIVVMLATGYGSKTIYTRLKDDVGNVSDIYSSATEYQIHNNPHLWDEIDLLTIDWTQLDLIPTDSITSDDIYTNITLPLEDAFTTLVQGTIYLINILDSAIGSDKATVTALVDDNGIGSETHWINVLENDSGSSDDRISSLSTHYLDTTPIGTDDFVQIDLIDILDANSFIENHWIHIIDLFDSGTGFDQLIHREIQFFDGNITCVESVKQIDLINIIDENTFVENHWISIIELYDSGIGLDNVISRSFEFYDSNIEFVERVVNINIDEIIDIIDLEETQWITLVELKDGGVATDIVANIEMFYYDSGETTHNLVNISIEELIDVATYDTNHWIDLLNIIDTGLATDQMVNLEAIAYDSGLGIDDFVQIDLIDIVDNSNISENHWIHLINLLDSGTPVDYIGKIDKEFIDEGAGEDTLNTIGIEELIDPTVLVDKAVQIDLVNLLDSAIATDLMSSIVFLVYDVAESTDTFIQIDLVNLVDENSTTDIVPQIDLINLLDNGTLEDTLISIKLNVLDDGLGTDDLIQIDLINLDDIISSDTNHWITLINLTDNGTLSDYVSKFEFQTFDTVSSDDNLNNINVDELIDAISLEEDVWIHIINLLDSGTISDYVASIEMTYFDYVTSDDDFIQIDLPQDDLISIGDRAIQIDLINLLDSGTFEDALVQLEAIVFDSGLGTDDFIQIDLINILDTSVSNDKAIQIDLINLLDSGTLEDTIAQFEMLSYDSGSGTDDFIQIDLINILDTSVSDDKAIQIDLINLSDSGTLEDIITQFEMLSYDSGLGTDDFIQIDLINNLDDNSFSDIVPQIDLINLSDSGTLEDIITQFEMISYDSVGSVDDFIQIDLINNLDDHSFSDIVPQIDLINLLDTGTLEDTIVQFEMSSYDSVGSDDVLININIDEIIDTLDLEEVHWITLVELKDSGTLVDAITQLEVIVSDSGEGTDDFIQIDLPVIEAITGNENHWIHLINLGDSGTLIDAITQFEMVSYDSGEGTDDFIQIDLPVIEIITENENHWIHLINLSDSGTLIDAIAQFEMISYDSGEGTDDFIQINLPVIEIITGNENHWIHLINLSDSGTLVDAITQFEMVSYDSGEGTDDFIQINLPVVEAITWNESHWITLVELKDSGTLIDFMSELEVIVSESAEGNDYSISIGIEELLESSNTTESNVIDLINLLDNGTLVDAITQFEMVSYDSGEGTDDFIQINVLVDEDLTWNENHWIDLINLSDSGILYDQLIEFERILLDYLGSDDNLIDINIDEIIDTLSLDEFAYITLVELQDNGIFSDDILEIEVISYDSVEATDSFVQIDLALNDSITWEETPWLEQFLQDEGTLIDAISQFEMAVYEFLGSDDKLIQIDITELLDNANYSTNHWIDLINLYDSGTLIDAITQFEMVVYDTGELVDKLIELRVVTFEDLNFTDRAIQIDLGVSDGGILVDAINTFEMIVYDEGTLEDHDAEIVILVKEYWLTTDDFIQIDLNVEENFDINIKGWVSLVIFLDDQFTSQSGHFIYVKDFQLREFAFPKYENYVDCDTVTYNEPNPKWGSDILPTDDDYNVPFHDNASEPLYGSVPDAGAFLEFGYNRMISGNHSVSDPNGYIYYVGYDTRDIEVDFSTGTNQFTNCKVTITHDGVEVFKLIDIDNETWVYANGTLILYSDQSIQDVIESFSLDTTTGSPYINVTAVFDYVSEFDYTFADPNIGFVRFRAITTFTSAPIYPIPLGQFYGVGYTGDPWTNHYGENVAVTDISNIVHDGSIAPRFVAGSYNFEYNNVTYFDTRISQYVYVGYGEYQLNITLGSSDFEHVKLVISHDGVEKFKLINTNDSSVYEDGILKWTLNTGAGFIDAIMFDNTTSGSPYLRVDVYFDRFDQWAVGDGFINFDITKLELNNSKFEVLPIGSYYPTWYTGEARVDEFFTYSPAPYACNVICDNTSTIGMIVSADWLLEGYDWTIFQNSPLEGLYDLTIEQYLTDDHSLDFYWKFSTDCNNALDSFTQMEIQVFDNFTLEDTFYIDVSMYLNDSIGIDEGDHWISQDLFDDISISLNDSLVELDIRVFDGIVWDAIAWITRLLTVKEDLTWNTEHWISQFLDDTVTENLDEELATIYHDVFDSVEWYDHAWITKLIVVFDSIDINDLHAIISQTIEDSNSEVDEGATIWLYQSDSALFGEFVKIERIAYDEFESDDYLVHINVLEEDEGQFIEGNTVIYLTVTDEGILTDKQYVTIDDIIDIFILDEFAWISQTLKDEALVDEYPVIHLTVTDNGIGFDRLIHRELHVIDEDLDHVDYSLLTVRVWDYFNHDTNHWITIPVQDDGIFVESMFIYWLIEVHEDLNWNEFELIEAFIYNFEELVADSTHWISQTLYDSARIFLRLKLNPLDFIVRWFDIGFEIDEIDIDFNIDIDDNLNTITELDLDFDIEHTDIFTVNEHDEFSTNWIDTLFSMNEFGGFDINAIEFDLGVTELELGIEMKTISIFEVRPI